MTTDILQEVMILDKRHLTRESGITTLKHSSGGKSKVGTTSHEKVLPLCLLDDCQYLLESLLTVKPKTNCRPGARNSAGSMTAYRTAEAGSSEPSWAVLKIMVPFRVP